MMQARAFAIAALQLAAAGVALAGAENLQTCTWPSGAPIEPRLCAKLRDLSDRDRLIAERAQAQADKALATEALRQAEAASQAAARQAVFEAEAAQRRQEDDARRAQTEAIARDVSQAQERAELQHEARMKQLRAECGADFQAPRVGMTLARARRCVGDLVLFGQVNRSNGVASVYRAGPLYLTVLGGNIVAWANTQPPPR